MQWLTSNQLTNNFCSSSKLSSFMSFVISIWMLLESGAFPCFKFFNACFISYDKIVNILLNMCSIPCLLLLVLLEPYHPCLLISECITFSVSSSLFLGCWLTFIISNNISLVFYGLFPYASFILFSTLRIMVFSSFHSLLGSLGFFCFNSRFFDFKFLTLLFSLNFGS